jgi:hypothetical protein
LVVSLSPAGDWPGEKDQIVFRFAAAVAVDRGTPVAKPVAGFVILAVASGGID